MEPDIAITVAYTMGPSEDPAPWTSDQEADAVLGDLRQQLDAAKSRMRNMREGIEATGRTAQSDGPDASA